MKIMGTLIKINKMHYIVVLVSFLMSCTSDKSYLSEGFWSYEYETEPLISKYGNFEFETNGTCHYYTTNHQVDGRWELGEYDKVSDIQIVKISMDSDINMGTGKSFEMKLNRENKACLYFSSGTGRYYHFNDNSKPIK